MDLLKAAIAERKAKLGAASSSSSSSSSSGGDLKRKASEPASSPSDAPVKKFKTRGELEAERRALAEQEKAERLKARGASSAAAEGLPPAAASAAAAAAASASPAAAAAAASPAASSSSASSSSSSSLLSEVEVKRRLRGYGEPLTLFGESEAGRFERLKLFELQQHERMTSSHGRGNQLAQILQHDVQSEIDAAMMRDMEQRRKEGEEAAAAAAAAAGSAAASGDEAAAASSSSSGSASGAPADGGSAVGSTKGGKADWRGVSLQRSDFESAEEFVLYFFKRMLSEWESELDARPTAVRMSERGKMASAVQKQTRAFLKPLLKLLKAKAAAADILRACELMCSACLRRDYNAANESYLTMAIGNAPWPMGVTMVSIHERAGRTKLHSNQVAHVLNDETQRKYIQSVKRLMTFCQEHYPAGAQANAQAKADEQP